MKKIILLLICLCMTACTSKPKKEEEKVVSKDFTPHVVIGGNTVEWEKDVPFNDLAYRNYDDSVKVTVSNDVDVSKEGTYTETYTLTKDNTTKTIKRKIIVTKKKSKKHVPVCMYHYLYKENNSDVNTNFMKVSDFEEEVQYLIDHHYYFPTFSELRDFIDGKINLPNKCIILTFDDGSTNTVKYLSKIAKEYKVPITSFMITSHDGEEKIKKYKNDYLTFESHTHNMHRPGGTIGRGGIFTALTVDEMVEDLKTSTKICGSHEALAYPFGDHTDKTKKAVKEAGFKVAFLIEPGSCKVGDDPYILPRVRMFNNQSIESFKARITQ